jgi:hypothetical protein
VQTFAAIDANQFYIVPHRFVLTVANQRMQDILAMRNPSTEMFALTPALQSLASVV